MWNRTTGGVGVLIGSCSLVNLFVNGIQGQGVYAAVQSAGFFLIVPVLFGFGLGFLLMPKNDRRSFSKSLRTLSLTCSCGAKLEIDEKFEGRVITCPDCQNEISTGPAPVLAAKTSGLAVASLLLALVGPLTLVLPLLAVIFGLIAQRDIARHPDQVGGSRFAAAGIILGGCFSYLSLAAFTPGPYLVDGVFREIAWAGKLDFSGSLTLDEERDDDKFTISVTRPNLSWGKVTAVLRGKDGIEDVLILINPWNDAQLTCVSMSYPFVGETDDVLLTRAGDHFFKSALVQFLTGQATIERKEDKPPTFRDMKNTSADGKTSFEMVIDLNLPGPPRTFLLRVVVDNSRMYVVAAGTRSAYFGRMEPQLRQLVSSFQVVHGT